MRLSLTSALLGGSVLASAAVLPVDPTAVAEDLADGVKDIIEDLAPLIPLEEFAKFTLVQPLTLEEALSGKNVTDDEPEAPLNNMKLTAAAAAQCANPRVRIEWDNYSNSDKQAFVNSLKCLMGRGPSGQFGQSKNRYEDLVALHQTLTPNVHSSSTKTNHKFLVWHRYFLWTFEQILRSECGFDRALPWFDETKYAGKFSQSSVFSNEWFGAIAISNQCVTNGQFAGITLNVGPGTGNGPHCLSRNGDSSKTINTGQAMVDACNQRNTYADMAGCAEGGAHAWGHNGIGAVMQDAYASPSDPVFWLHHAFVDRNFRIWQNANSARVNTIDGVDSAGRALTLDTNINVYGFRPDVRIRDVLDTTGETLCYKYNY